MTQELVLWVLVAVVIGLLWVLTFAIFIQDRSLTRSYDAAQGDKDQDKTHTPKSSHGRAAA